MAMVVTQLCHGCKHTACVAVCPAECFHEGESMLFIDPERCIDCGLCAPECPQQAIFYDDRVPREWQSDIEFNRRMSQCCPKIIEPNSPNHLEVTTDHTARDSRNPTRFHR